MPRLRCSWNPRGTWTGRLSSSANVFGTGGNMQNLHPEFMEFLVADEGHMLIDFDKAGAEWVVVAYICQDENMLEIVRSGESPHVATGHLITGAPKELILLENKIVDKASDPDEIARLRNGTPGLLPLLALPFLPRSMSIRQAGKKSNHGLNYGMKYRRFALENEIPEAEAADMVELYTKAAYPRIPSGFWEPTVAQLRKDRTLRNCFGRKVRLLGEWGVELFDKAYSFVPQSTVGDIVNRAIRAAYEDEAPSVRKADLLVQTHDSATYQYPLDFGDMADFIIRFSSEEHLMNPTLEYSGTKFRIGTDVKVGLNRGHMKEVKLSGGASELADRLEEAWIAATKSLGAQSSEAPQAHTPPVAASGSAEALVALAASSQEL